MTAAAVFLLGGAPETRSFSRHSIYCEKNQLTRTGRTTFIMIANAVTDAQFFRFNRTKGLGAQGLSQYNSVGNRSVAGWPYANNMAFEKQWWARAATGLDVVFQSRPDG